VIDVSASIASALRNRAEQAPSIDKINHAWGELAETLDVVLATAGSIGGDWRLGDFQELRAMIAAGMPEMTAMTARFHRETVNIGVIGRTKAGKSTLLRTITGLGMDVLPSRRDNPTTAARSRIQHSPGQASAKIALYAWPEFRDRYLRPLHVDGHCDGPLPDTPEDFLKYPYHRLLDSSRGRGSADRGIYRQQFLERLCDAQDSFNSYRGYLLGPQRSLTITNMGELRAFVAYPEGKSHDRPYHAVRDVWIRCPFNVGGVEQLVLVDLPGAGEAALDIDVQFLAELTNEVDLLMQVKLPALTEAFIGEQDWDVLRLADAASMGVDPADFLAFVINTYPGELDQNSVANATRDAHRITDRNGVQLHVGDVQNPDDVRDKILGPVLEHLALRLAAMDRKAARTQIDKALTIADQASRLADQGAAEVGRRRRLVPDDQKALREAANELRGRVARQMKALREDYARRAQEQEPIQELTEAIAGARERLLKWADAGFGKGTRQQWLTAVEAYMSVDPGEARDDQCTLVRARIRAEFGRIDSSIVGAIERLHRTVADELRRGFTEQVVPVGNRPLDALRETALERGLEGIHSALNELIEVRAGYGSVFLRVGGPIVRQMRPVAGTIEAVAPGTARAPDHQSGGSLYDNARRAGSALGAFRANAAGAAAAAHPAAGVAVAGVQMAAAAAPLVADLIARVQVRVVDESAAGLHAALTEAFREAVRQIEELMRAEASQLTQVLSAAADEFFDSFFRTPGIQEEWAGLCEPVREELWPATFGSGTADLVAGLGRIADAMSLAVAAAAEMRAAAAGTETSGARD
jgi:hypothetical protein